MQMMIVAEWQVGYLKWSKIDHKILVCMRRKTSVCLYTDCEEISLFGTLTLYAVRTSQNIMLKN